MASRNGARVKSRGTVVAKSGTSTMTLARSDGARVALDEDTIRNYVEGMADLIDNGYGVISVTSGAVAAGMADQGVTVRERRKMTRENDITSLRYFAGIGQPILMLKFKTAFEKYGITVSQSLTERNSYHDAEHRKDMKALRARTLKERHVVIVNGNDATTKAELHIGDNDFTALHEAIMVGAKYLVFFTDQEGILLPSRTDPTQKELIEKIDLVSPELFAVLGSKSKLGTGGPGTKIMVCDVARRSGILPIIAGKDKAKCLLDIVEGRAIATRFSQRGSRPLDQKTACEIVDAIAKHGTDLSVEDYFFDITNQRILRIAVKEARSPQR